MHPARRFEADLVTLSFERADAEGIASLMRASDIFHASLYPAESNHGSSLDQLLMEDVYFVVARHAGEAIGCGALVDMETYGELKRMWVVPEARGMKVGKRILRQLERKADELGMALLRLETGIHQPEAISLYRRSGYTDVPPFGDYKPDPLSLFMEKRLADKSDA